MYIFSRVSASSMVEAFQRIGAYEELGGYTGIIILHDYLVNYAEELGEPIEFSPGDLRIKWSNYNERELFNDYVDDAADYYDEVDPNAEEDSDEWHDSVESILEYLRKNTTVLQHDNGWLIDGDF